MTVDLYGWTGMAVLLAVSAVMAARVLHDLQRHPEYSLARLFLVEEARTAFGSVAVGAAAATGLQVLLLTVVTYDVVDVTLAPYGTALDVTLYLSVYVLFGGLLYFLYTFQRITRKRSRHTAEDAADGPDEG